MNTLVSLAILASVLIQDKDLYIDNIASQGKSSPDIISNDGVEHITSIILKIESI